MTGMGAWPIPALLVAKVANAAMGQYARTQKTRATGSEP
jgi:hypothetical protein